MSSLLLRSFVVCKQDCASVASDSATKSTVHRRTVTLWRRHEIAASRTTLEGCHFLFLSVQSFFWHLGRRFALSYANFSRRVGTYWFGGCDAQISRYEISEKGLPTSSNRKPTSIRLTQQTQLTMQFRTALVPLALSALAAATTTVTVTAPSPPVSTPIPASQCNTGPVQCCNSVQAANSGGLLSPVTLILGLLGLVVQPVNAIVGLTCNPISVIGIGGNSCTAQPVCCQNNSFNGLIAIGCTPVNLNL
ncbi:unnamed protein product [Cyclocybe aegerita]|uniref:Hydrophobin n=1 Tax=Cyclocybe aegerita TaxID=1973307 RepID=A0A8S0WJF7_CYCAE|nr:unnamed protein product [Cyclocybe aegerita]